MSNNLVVLIYILVNVLVQLFAGHAVPQAAALPLVQVQPGQVVLPEMKLGHREID